MATSNTTTVPKASKTVASQAQTFTNHTTDGPAKFPPVDTSKSYLKLLMKEPYQEANDWEVHARNCRTALRNFSDGQPTKHWKSVPVFDDNLNDGDDQGDSDDEEVVVPSAPELVDFATDSEPDEAPSPKRKLSSSAAVRCDNPPKRAAPIYEPWLDAPMFYDWSKFTTTNKSDGGVLSCTDQSTKRESKDVVAREEAPDHCDTVTACDVVHE